MRVMKELGSGEIEDIIEKYIYSTTQARPDSVRVNVRVSPRNGIVADIDYVEHAGLPPVVRVNVDNEQGRPDNKEPK